MNQKKFIFEKTINVFAWLSFVLAIFITILTIIASFSGSDNGKAIFGHKLLIVNTDSMSKSPLSENESIFFNAGDLIVINTNGKYDSLKEGDVITFISTSQESYGKTLTHKIREVKTSNGQVVGYVTYGIYTGTNDSAMVPVSNVIGVYSFKIPQVGKIFAFLKTPRGYYLSVLAPILLLIIYFSLKIGKALGAKNSKTDYEDEIARLKERVLCLENSYNNYFLQNNDAETTEEVKSLINQKEQNNLISTKNVLLIPKGNKISFLEKLLALDDNIKSYFNNVHNQLVLYKKINYRLSFKCISYRYKKQLLAKMTVRGKTLKLHLALNVNDFNPNIFFQKDLSLVKAYKNVPFTVKVKSERGKNNAIKLIDELVRPYGLVKDDKFVKVNALEILSDCKSQDCFESIALKIKKGKKVSFIKRVLKLENAYKSYFDTIHNELISYKKIHARFSFKCVSYRLGRKLLAKMIVRGKTLRLNLALNVNDFNYNVFFQKDLSTIKAYTEVPFAVKIKSERAKNNAIKLVSELMEKISAEKNTKFNKIDSIKMLKTIKEN